MEQKSGKKLNIAVTIFVYWITLLLWQAIRPVANRSLVDIGFKIGLFLFVVCYGMLNINLNKTKNIAVFFLIFVSTQFVTVWLDSKMLSMSSIITVLFMIVQIAVMMMFLRNEPLTVKQLELFGKCIVVTVFLMCVYNMIFQWGEFSNLFSSGGAYGHECTSILYSNHEFGIYIATAILLLVWFAMKKQIRWYLSLPLGMIFALNLMSTYSRTALLGCIIALYILLFFYNKRILIAFLAVTALILILSAFIDGMNGFIFDKLLKGSFDGENGIIDEGRADMYNNEFNAFIESGELRWLIGRGYGITNYYMGHNAYLYVLNVGGVIMFVLFLATILFGMYNAFMCFRRDKSVGSLLIGFIVFALLYMVAQTSIIFYSSLDSFFITTISVFLPMYTYNGYLLSDEEEAKKRESTADKLRVSEREYRADHERTQFKFSK